MKDRDISAHFPGVYIIHQKIRGNEVGEHLHEEHEFFFPLQGEIQIQVLDKTLKAGPGKMIYLPPETLHSFRADSNSQGERLILISDPHIWKKHQGGQFSPGVMSSSQLCIEILFQLLIHPKTKASKALIETLIQTMSEMLEGAYRTFNGDLLHTAGQSQDERVKTALGVIEENFTSAMSTEEIARKSGMSVRNCNRLFLTEIGMTPKQVVTICRIELAKQLLSNGKKSVTDISFEVGYNSVSQFISTFRKVTGQLPSSFLPLK